jgi:2-deoxystreptamine N-acetyl-D-glucosaminyltransferase/2-deoxystreptamine glucosyltransferase
MQNHTAVLSRCLDVLGLRQSVVTARLAGAAGTERLGNHGRVMRVGLRTMWLRQLWALAALPTILRPGGSVDVVHVHQGEDVAALPLGKLAARLHRCPMVVTVHCSVRHTLVGRSVRVRLLRGLGGRVERWFLLRADGIIVLAERTAALLRQDGVPPARIHRIPSGFDPALFEDDRADRFPDLRRPRVGYVGRLVPQKRADLLVAAFGLLRQPAHLVIVGDGPDRKRIEALVAASPVADRITLHGFVEHEIIPSVLGSLDVLVLPSEYEELGSVLVEAMVAGLPVVASRVGGIPEVVEEGRTGVLVTPGDAVELAAAIDRLLGDPSLIGDMRAHARRRSEAWAWPALARRVAELYEAVLPVAARG